MSARNGGPPAAGASANGSPDIRLRLLKGFALLHDGRAAQLPSTAQRVVAFLALHRRPLHRVYVASNLWIAMSEERANASLRTALWRLRRLGDAGIEATATKLGLAEYVEVDYVEQLARAERILRQGNGDIDDLDALCRAGDLLPDWYDDWVLTERERFRQLRLLALERLCAQFTAAGRTAEAMQGGLAAVVGEPLRETAHRVLIDAHLASGNTADALRQYRLFRRLLASQLGLEPSPELRQLMAAVPGADTFAG